MFGLLNKQVDQSLLEQEFDTDRKKLAALLETDLKIVQEEKKQILDAVRVLKNSNARLTKEHIETIRSRLALVHANLLRADQEVKKRSEHFAVEATTLNSLTQKAEEIYALIQRLKQKK
ncbi:hypothetical protein HYX11_00565 [Candidatus Woesearchaeota archaeon]|nr:hypothetical protein [Candidatus Woesearchaeota archaeon]